MGKARNPKLPYVPFNIKKLTKQNSLSLQDQQNLFRLIQSAKYSSMVSSRFPKFNLRGDITSNNRKQTKGRYWKPQFINKKKENEEIVFFKRPKRILHKVK